MVERVAALASVPAQQPPDPPLAQMPALPGKARTVLALAAGLTLVACVAETRHQLGYWQDSVTLFGRALEITPDDDVALNNYCLELFSQGKYEEAAARL